jgi:P-type Mg2+ transporter
MKTHGNKEPVKPDFEKFWSLSTQELLRYLESSPAGLTPIEAKRRLERYGYNIIRPRKKHGLAAILWTQFKSPLVIILILAAILSFVLGDHTDGFVILIIVIISGLLGFWQEYQATSAVQKLVQLVQIKANVLRSGKPGEIPVEDVVPGDIIRLKAGDAVPADSLVLESQDLFVDEAILTGESFPTEKEAGVAPPDTSLKDRHNTVFMGTHVTSGSATILAVSTGLETEFGRIAERLQVKPPETEFEYGIRKFGYLLIEITLTLVIAIFAINMIFLARPALDSFLFSLALAVGLTPELLPAIITINLAKGARRMANRHVIVKRLAAIEDFGGMDVLCADKTGTLTEGKMKLDSAQDITGGHSEKVLLYAYLNARFETGYTNPIDKALLEHSKIDIAGYRKLDEIPYDFVRKRLSILLSKDNEGILVTKGAVAQVLAISASIEMPDGRIVTLSSMQKVLIQHYEELSRNGFRTLGIAYKSLKSPIVNRSDEARMTFLGFLVFLDPPKPGISRTIARLKELGISLKLITGDNRLVTEFIARKVGLVGSDILTGREVEQMSNAALLLKVNKVDIFAELEPNHKERIIVALAKTGHVVGYMGDGINDAPALHAADVGISVNTAVDVAKEAADIVLLNKDLNVLVAGVEEGRRTFINTLKYVFMTMSANFGNMFSMAGASLFLPFLPLLPKQILLTNLLSDVPCMTITADNVDEEMMKQPTQWNIGFLRKFMIVFGLLSSVFDFLTFFLLFTVIKANPDLFRTGWFIESCVSEILVVLVIRSRRFFLRSKPGRYLFWSTIATCIASVVLPFTPLGRVFGFTPLSVPFLLLMGLIVLLYIALAEVTKRIFYRNVKI